MEAILAESLSSLRFLGSDDELVKSCLAMYRRDYQSEMQRVNTTIKSPGFLKFTIKELRVIDFLKKENVKQGLEKCKTPAEVFGLIRPLLITYI